MLKKIEKRSALEIPAFVGSLEGYQGSLLTKYATQILVLTGVSTVELREASWCEFNLDDALWEIPKEQIKQRRSLLLPLSSQAVEILKKLKVFTGRNDVRKPMSDASINKVIKMLGYHGRLTGHGFHHMMSTILHEHGFKSVWIEVQLAHVH